MWRCKECGGAVVLKQKRMIERGFILDKNGDAKFCFMESEDKVNKSYYHCQKCDKEWNSKLKIKDIAEWIKRND